MFGPKAFCLKISCVQKKVWAEEIFGSIKVLSLKRFWVGKIGFKNFKRILVQQVLHSPDTSSRHPIYNPQKLSFYPEGTNQTPSRHLQNALQTPSKQPPDIFQQG